MCPYHYPSPAVANTATATKRLLLAACKTPARNRGYVVTIISITGGVIASTAVILRLSTRLSRQGGKFMMDDISIIISMVYLFLSIFDIIAYHHLAPSNTHVCRYSRS